MKSPKTPKKTPTKATSKSTPKKTAPKATITESPKKAIVTQTEAKKPSPKKKAPAKEKTPVVATPEITIPERVGSTAGSIWHYLTKNGTIPVAKLLREIEEEEKIIQRSIGWLAQEGKIILGTSGKGETITLND